MRRATTYYLLATSAALLALAPPASADWPIYGHDLANTRSAGADGPSLAEAASLKQAWTFSSSHGDFTGTPVIAGGTLVAGTNLGTVYALDAVTGKLRWTHDVGHPVTSSAAIDLGAAGGPAVFVPVAQSGSPHLVALSLADGSQRWDTVLTRGTGATVFGSPVFWDGAVYMGTSAGNNDESDARGTVTAIDESTGALRWQTFTVPPGHDGGGVWTTPAIDTATGRVYVGTGNAYHPPAADTTDSIMALDASDGRILGHFQTTPGDVWELDNPLAGPDYDFGASANLLTAPDGRALVGEGSKSGDYWALDRTTMTPVWHTSIGPGSNAGGILASTAYDGTRVYGTDSLTGKVWALGRDGREAWTSSDTTILDWAPAATGNGVLYNVPSRGVLIARNAATGAVLSQLPLGGPTFGGVSVVGRAVYVATGTGPPPQAIPDAPSTEQFDGNGSIVAFGDTSQSGGTQQVAAVRKPAFRLAVAPRHTLAGRRVAFRFRALRGGHGVRGATIAFARHRMRTRADGRARLVLRLPAGRYTARASRAGVGRTVAVVTVSRPARGAASRRRPLTFSGSCDFEGAVRFQPALTNSPQDVRQVAELRGPCSGTLVDHAGRTHELDGTLVRFLEISQGNGASCLAGIADGTAVLYFPYGRLRALFHERRVGGTPAIELTGRSSGSAWGVAYPSTSQDPAAALQACAGSGLERFALAAHAQTTPSISG